MKINSSKLGTRISAIFISFALALVSFFPARATKTVDDLEQDASGLNSELSDLNSELENLEEELEDILSEIAEISDELESTKEELAIAKGQEEAQYESMKLRIQYMYENGGTSMLEMLFSSSCMAEFLNRAEYVSKINDYDHKLLEEFEENRNQIAEKEAKLQEDREYLNALQDDLASKEDDLKNKISTTSDELASCTEKLERAKEEARKAEEEAKKKVEPVIPEPPKRDDADGSGIDTSYGTSIEATASDVELLAALIECEAGSTDYEGMLAVGSVVVNRMKSSYYPDTLYGVIYQSGQFTPADNGKVEKVIQRGVKASCVKAAQDALNGKNNVGDCVSFRAASSGHAGTIIGDNVFF